MRRTSDMVAAVILGFGDLSRGIDYVLGMWSHDEPLPGPWDSTHLVLRIGHALSDRRDAREPRVEGTDPCHAPLFLVWRSLTREAGAH